MYRYYIFIYITVYTRGGHYDGPLKSAEVLTTTVILLCSVIFINRTSSSSSYNLCAAFLSPLCSSRPNAHYRRSVIVVIITTRVAFVVARFPSTDIIIYILYRYVIQLPPTIVNANTDDDCGDDGRWWESATMYNYIILYTIYLMLIYYVVFPCHFFSTCLYHPFINVLYIYRRPRW